MPRARALTAAAATSTLEDAAKTAGLTATRSPQFTRVSGADGIGRLNEAIGTAFALPQAAVSAPVRTHDAIFIERVDRRILSDSTAWEKQKDVQRVQLTNQIRQQRIREFLTNLRESAKIEDKRKEIEAANRHTSQ